MTKVGELIPRLLSEFPEFQERWDEHVRHWKGESAGSYNDLAEFVHFVVEDLYEKGKIERTRHVFAVVERMLNEGDADIVELISLGFFETLQNVASWPPGGAAAFKPLLGVVSTEVWAELDQLWAGKSSLMDVIRSEKEREKT